MFCHPEDASWPAFCRCISYAVIVVTLYASSLAALVRPWGHLFLRRVAAVTELTSLRHFRCKYWDTDRILKRRTRCDTMGRTVDEVLVRFKAPYDSSYWDAWILTADTKGWDLDDVDKD